MIITNISKELPAIEERFKRLENDVSMLQSCTRSLYQLDNQIASATKLLNSLRMSCNRERREISNLYNEKRRLEDIVTKFKNNNDECLNEIKHAAFEEVKTVLTDGKLLLKIAIASIIESLRINSEIYDFVLNDISNETTSGSNYPSLIFPGQQQQQSFSDDIYVALILEEAEKLYNALTTKLTDDLMAAAAAIKTISSISLPDNNQPEIYNNDRAIK